MYVYSKSSDIVSNVDITTKIRISSHLIEVGQNLAFEELNLSCLGVCMCACRSVCTSLIPRPCTVTAAITPTLHVEIVENGSGAIDQTYGSNFP